MFVKNLNLGADPNLGDFTVCKIEIPQHIVPGKFSIFGLEIGLGTAQKPSTAYSYRRC